MSEGQQRREHRLPEREPRDLQHERLASALQGGTDIESRTGARPSARIDDDGTDEEDAEERERQGRQRAGVAKRLLTSVQNRVGPLLDPASRLAAIVAGSMVSGSRRLRRVLREHGGQGAFGHAGNTNMLQRDVRLELRPRP